MERAFLDSVAVHLHEKYASNLSNLVVVLPNKRAGLFLKQHLSKYFKNTIWLPQIISSEDFFLQLSQFKKLDSISLLFRFYEAYQNCNADNGETFEEFAQWGQLLLQDFNEIDQYLIDTEALFSYVNDVRAIEVWNVDGSEITETQKNYLAFWKQFKPYYESLRKLLLARKECYQGLAYRWVAENMQSQQFFEENKHYVFAGFNALNKSEENVIDYLVRTNKADVLFDADEYYLNDNYQEAGMFLRRFKAKWDFKQFNWVSNNWTKGTKEIEITGVNGNVNQTLLAAELLEKLKDSTSYQNTALVLADEHLLDPMLEVMPNAVEHINVTMGYALEHSPMHSLWLAWIKMHENAIKYSSANTTTYHYKDVVRLLNHPYVKCNTAAVMVEKIVKFNWVFIGVEKLMNEIDQNNAKGVLPILFNPWRDEVKVAVDQMIALIQWYRETWDNLGHNKQSLEYLHLYHKSIHQLQILFEEYNGVVTQIKTLKQLFMQQISKQSVDFYGEPLKGLQLMGVLETRTLDFENVILLSANEGTIPLGKTTQSFIPFEIKRKFKLPTHVEKDGLFAYHFYRLLQRAKKIHLIYNTDVDAFSGSEQSRFVTQLEQEVGKVNSNITLKHQQLVFDVKAQGVSDQAILKTESIQKQLEKYLESGISPSALNTYINCPLDFYYKYVLGIKVNDEVEENIEASTMGTVIHKVLEDVYKPFVGKVVQADDLKLEFPKIEERTKQAFKKENFSDKELSAGKNFLTLNVVVKFITDFLKREIDFLNQLKIEGKSLTILKLEEKLSASVCIAGKTYKVKGTADRVDKIGNTVRVIDYKTGVVEQKQLIVDDMEKLTMDSMYSKALQLMLYGMMFAATNEKHGYDIVPGIISFRRLSEGFMDLRIEDAAIDKETLLRFDKILQGLFTEILSDNVPFEHQNSAKYCNFCDI